MNVYGIIMAGGGGTRFWPLSRKDVPKQFLNLTGRELMVNEAIDRLQPVIGLQNIFIVTNQQQADLMLKETKGRIAGDHILAEPAARNTSACIGYAAMEIVKKYGDGILCIFPSDHYISDEEGFRTVIGSAVRVAEETDRLVTIGIKPTFPSTGYGYIKAAPVGGMEYSQVEEFVEKPDYDTAAAWLKAGGYSWNSGMFIWKASTILGYFEKLLPDIYACLAEIGTSMGTEAEKEVLRRIYPAIPKISIDYGIMERAQGVLMLQGDFGWNDVGSWDALEALYEKDENGNISHGDHLYIDAAGCITYAKNKLIALTGVQDLIIVEADQAVLVCPKDRAQDVKNIVEKLRQENRDEYL